MIFEAAATQSNYDFWCHIVPKICKNPMVNAIIPLLWLCVLTKSDPNKQQTLYLRYLGSSELHFQVISTHFVRVEADDSYKVKVKGLNRLSQQMFKLKRKEELLTFPNCFCRRFSPSLSSSIGTGTCWQLSCTNTHKH